MATFRTDFRTDGPQTVEAGDEYKETVQDGYRHLYGLDLYGDVERDVYVLDDSGSKRSIFGGRVLGETGIPLELDIDVESGDTLVIAYHDSGTVSDVWLMSKLAPLGRRARQEVREHRIENERLPKA